MEMRSGYLMNAHYSIGAVVAIRKIFAANLRRLLTARNVFAKDLARDLGVTQSAISRWKMGDDLPSADNIDKIARYLKVALVELFRDDASDDPHSIKDVRSALEAFAKALDLEVIEKKDK